MARARLEIDHEALDEAEAAEIWYAHQGTAMGERFADELDRAYEEITGSPERWPKYLRGTRVYCLDRFPYMIAYRISDDVVYVVAVFHASRRPGYWKRRLT